MARLIFDYEDDIEIPAKYKDVFNLIIFSDKDELKAFRDYWNKHVLEQWAEYWEENKTPAFKPIVLDKPLVDIMFAAVQKVEEYIHEHGVMDQRIVFMECDRNNIHKSLSICMKHPRTYYVHTLRNVDNNYSAGCEQSFSDLYLAYKTYCNVNEY